MLFLVDLGDDDPLDTITVLEQELTQHSPAFSARLRLYAFNKADIPENSARFDTLSATLPENAYLISAATGQGTRPLLEALWKAVEAARQAEAEREKEIVIPQREYVFQAPFEIVRTPEGFRITGEKPLQAVNMTDFDNEEAVAHLQRRLEKMGVFKALKRMKAQPGQSVIIGDYEMEYQD